MAAPRAAKAHVHHTDLGSRVDTFLGEFRMIIPAMAALFGFQLTVAFQQSFAALPTPEQAASFAAMVCTAVAFLFLLVPAAYHRFTAEFDETEEFLRFGRRTIALAFYFIPATLVLTLYVQAVQVFGSRLVGALVGGSMLAACLLVWWVVPLRRATREGHWPVHRHEPGPARPAKRPNASRRAKRPNSSSRTPRRTGPPARLR